MHIDVVPNRGSQPAVLLRESYREGKKVRKRTLANLSSLPMAKVELIRCVLRGDALAPVESLFDITESRLHGHVAAVLTAMRRLGVAGILSARPCRERDLVMAMMASRILDARSKLATTRWWHTTTLPEELGIADATEEDLYSAMDWLLEQQPRIEKALARRHLEKGGLVLYDLSSSYFEGTACPLAALGHSRDGRKGKLQVNYGLVTDRRGCPVAVSVHPGNTNDTKTFLPQVETIRGTFGIEEVVLVGDRGMISQKQIDELAKVGNVDWITALKTGAIRQLVESGQLQMGLFDERNLFELSSDEYPGERLVACRNRELARLRAAKRQSLLDATVRELDKVRSMVARGRGKAPQSADEIGVRVGKVIDKYKVGKHFRLDIGEKSFTYSIDQEKVAAEAALDGIYVIRTSLPESRMSADDAVRGYKLLSGVERAFRSIKTVDLKVRPIHHHLEDRVRAHIFLCMLAYHVEWHMLEAWRELLFSDEDTHAKESRDPVAPARRSETALAKVHDRVLDDETPVHSFRTLLAELGTVVRNTCRRKGADADEATFTVATIPSAKQQRALDLIAALRV
jgi:transposase